MRIEMWCCDAVILNEIAQGLDQKQIAMSYGLALRSSYDTDWEAVNKAIIERWSVSGLSRIKEAAWAGKWRGVPFGSTK